jgi:hypothetical protein
LLSRSLLKLTTNNNTTAPKTAVTTLATLKPPAPEILIWHQPTSAADNTNDYVANDTKTTTADN